MSIKSEVDTRVWSRQNSIPILEGERDLRLIGNLFAHCILKWLILLLLVVIKVFLVSIRIRSRY